jgi:hypothetical protein
MEIVTLEITDLSECRSVDLFWSLADRWKSSGCEYLTKAVRSKTQIGQRNKPSI